MKRKLGLGILIGVAVGWFVRWRGGFSHAVDAVQEQLPDALTPERKEEGPTPGGEPDDAVLRDRVMTEVLRDDRFKGHVNVATEYGRVVLHGELENPDLIEELVSQVRGVDGVRDVESRLNVHEQQTEVQLPERPAE